MRETRKVEGWYRSVRCTYGFSQAHDDFGVRGGFVYRSGCPWSRQVGSAPIVHHKFLSQHFFVEPAGDFEREGHTIPLWVDAAPIMTDKVKALFPVRKVKIPRRERAVDAQSLAQMFAKSGCPTSGFAYQIDIRQSSKRCGCKAPHDTQRAKKRQHAKKRNGIRPNGSRLTIEDDAGVVRVETRRNKQSHDVDHK